MKPKISQILKKFKDCWIPTSINLPEPGNEVIIRLCHQTDITGEDENFIYPLENVAIASISQDKWVISPPYPRFDFSPLSTKEEIHDHVDVTHWREASENDILMWRMRWDRIRKYKHLNLEVDSENVEDVYRALLWASYYMANFGGPDILKEDSDLKKFHEIICDLQQSIDSKEESEFTKLTEHNESIKHHKDNL